MSPFSAQKNNFADARMEPPHAGCHEALQLISGTSSVPEKPLR
jgi:hypothetical protein